MRAGTWAALVSSILAAGCASGPDPADGGNKPLFQPPPGLDSRLEFDFNYAWEDLPRDHMGVIDPVEKAYWITERFNAAQSCLNAEPMALQQATELLEEILRREGGNTRARQLLAQCYFLWAAYWFKNADVVAWSTDLLIREGRLPDGSQVEDPETRTKLEEEYKTYLDKANKEVKALATRALEEFNRFRTLRPERREVADAIWKLHFFLQQYEEALQWLDLVLREMDLAEVDSSDPVRKDYSAIRSQLVDYLAQLRLDSATRTPRGLIPSLTRSQAEEESKQPADRRRR